MNELLGFVVLTGPLFLVVLWFPICVWLAWKLARNFKRIALRIIIGVLGFLVLMVVPVTDEILGRLYFNHLCTTKAGVKIYQTVALPAEYWDEQGRARFFNERGYLDHKFWVSKLDESGGHIGRYSSVFAIDEDTSLVKEKDSQKLLAEVTTFRFWGGWMLRNFSPHNTAESCKFISAPNFSRSFYGQLFKPDTSYK